jgi:polyhydroxybutyrate depolymerase
MSATMALGQAQVPEATVRKTMKSGGRERTYEIHVGKAVVADHPAPLVIVMHGSGGSGRQMEASTGFSRVADREGFIVVYPDSTRSHWHDGRVGPRFVEVKDVDDVRFIRDLVKEVSRHHRIDRKRIYATGLSNGGFMSNRLGLAASDIFAAIAPVAGTLGVEFKNAFAPKKSLSILVNHGTEDNAILYSGGKIANGDGGECLAVADIVSKWVKVDRCQDKAETTTLPDTDPNDGCTVKQEIHAGKQATVELLTIEGGVHAWPGGSAKGTGVCQDFNGAEYIWAFFKSHPGELR